MGTQSEKFQNFILFSSLSITFLFLILSCIPQFRETLRTLALYPQRTVLAKVEGDLSGRGDRVTVIKVKTHQALAIEVFFFSENPNTREMRRIILPEKNEGYFNFRGQASNLVLSDVDGDGTLEILAPSFDDNLVPRLNVFQFDPDLRIFKRLTSEQPI